MMKWTSTSKKMPDKPGDYLVYMPYGIPGHKITVATMCDGYWCIKTPISAWMPLPQEYKEEIK